MQTCSQEEGIYSDRGRNVREVYNTIEHNQQMIGDWDGRRGGGGRRALN